MDPFIIRRGDLLPLLAGVLRDARGPVDLSGATVRVHLRDKVTHSPVVNALATADPDQVANRGRFSYEWVAADTAKAGELEGEVQVTFGSGKVQTFPNHGTFPVTVTPQVA